GIALRDGRPAGRSWAFVGLAAGALGVILSGAMTAVLGLWLAVAAVLLGARVLRALDVRRALALLGVALVVTAGTATMRADTIERFAEFIGLREKTADTGVGWQASSEEWAYGPFLDAARARFPDEPDQAFPSPEHPWGIQLLYLQVAADLGIAGIVVLLGLAAAGIATGIRGIRSSPVALCGLGWLLVVVGVWTGIGLVSGLPLGALTWLSFGLVAVRD